jgi:methylamine dehydrogenase accessory protein MauD
MSSLLLVSYITLWLLVLLLFLSVVVLARQIGVLHKRIMPQGARMLDAGPGIGETLPMRQVTDAFGAPVTIGGKQAKKKLLLFLSPECASCEDLAPAIRTVHKKERKTLDVVLIGVDGDDAGGRDFLKRNSLQGIPWVSLPDLASGYRIGSPPYAVILDESGEVRGKGIVNRLEHVESILAAAERGHPTLEAYMNTQAS